MLPLLGMTALLFLSGCGGDSASLPETYAVGEESMPALGMVGAVGTEGTTFTAPGDEEENEEGSEEESKTLSYVYSGLSSGRAEAEIYVTALMVNYDYKAIDEEGIIQEAPDFSTEEGSVLLGKNTEAGDGILQLALQWTADSCTVDVSFVEGLQVSEPKPLPSLTVTEAVDTIEGLSPSQLGLEGTSMDAYLVYAREGYVLVDGEACYQLDVYNEDHSIQETCLLSLDGQLLYSLDRSTGQITELT